MKTFFSVLILSTMLSCGPSPLRESYRVSFPSSAQLTAILGECRWRLEWYDSKGTLRQTTTLDNAVINILPEWPSAILAWPYWPEKGLAAGLFYPAGALFPFDLSGDTIILSWEAGAEAFFYRELDKLREQNSTNRVPEFFDWKRFRTFVRENAPEEIRLDPWLADWKAIAERTVNSGFRSSYIRAETRTETAFMCPHDGPWLSFSPFRAAEFWEKDEEVYLPLSAQSEIFVSPGGMLCVSANSFLWTVFFD